MDLKANGDDRKFKEIVLPVLACILLTRLAATHSCFFQFRACTSDINFEDICSFCLEHIADHDHSLFCCTNDCYNSACPDCVKTRLEYTPEKHARLKLSDVWCCSCLHLYSLIRSFHAVGVYCLQELPQVWIKGSRGMESISLPLYQTAALAHM